MLPPRRLAALQPMELMLLEHRHRVRHRLKIVEQARRAGCRSASAMRSASTVPRHVGQLGRIGRAPVRRRRSRPTRSACAPCAVSACEASEINVGQVCGRSSVANSGRPAAAGASGADRRGRAASWCRRCRLRGAFSASPAASQYHGACRFSLTSPSFSFILSALPIRPQARTDAGSGGRLPALRHLLISRSFAARGTPRRLHRKAELARPQGRARAGRASGRRDGRRRQREDDDAGRRRRGLRAAARARAAVNKLKRAEELNDAAGAPRSRSSREEQFCRLAGVPTPER